MATILGERCIFCGSRLLICLKCSGYGFSRIKRKPAVFCPKCDERCPKCGIKVKMEVEG